MIRKKYTSAMVAAILALNVAACGNSASDSENTTAKTVTETVGEGSTESEQTEADTQNIGGNEVSENGSDAENYKELLTDEAEDALSDDGILVENNGSYFVRVGNDVWFRAQDVDVLQRVSYDGYFLASPAEENKEPYARYTSICRYDLETGMYFNPIRDTERGFGPIYYADDFFYLMRVKDDSVIVYRMDMEGRQIENVCDGYIIDITDSGTLVISPDDGSTGYALYKGTEEIARYETDYGWIEYCGSAEEDIYFFYGEGSDERWLMELSPDGTVRHLGLLPGSPNECEDFVYDSGKVYMLLTRRDWDTHSAADRTVVKFIPGREDSIEVMTPDYLADDGDDIAYLQLTGDSDEVMIVPHYSGEIGLSEGSFGDLIMYDGSFGATRLINDFITSDPYSPDGPYAEFTIAQELELVGNTVFICTADTEWAPVEDEYGLSAAYMLKVLNINFLPVFDFETGDMLIFDGEGELGFGL